MISEKDGHILEFDEVKHRYKLDGHAVPGVTTFIKGGYPTSHNLIGWQISQGAKYTANMIQRLRRDNPSRVISGKALKEIVKRSKTAYTREAARAAGIGTIVHDYAYLTEIGRLEDACALLASHTNNQAIGEIRNGIEKYKDWRRQNKGETVLLEAIVASVRYSFAGKFDHLSLRSGLLVLSDYKTSNGIYVDQFIQLAAYAVAIEEWLDQWLQAYGLPTKIGGLEILRFGKEHGEYQPLFINNPTEIATLKDQAIRCRQNYKFKLSWEADRRFNFTGGTRE